MLADLRVKGDADVGGWRGKVEGKGEGRWGKGEGREGEKISMISVTSLTRKECLGAKEDKEPKGQHNSEDVIAH